MPNITRGERMGGLLAYLQGPGRANEHTEPHLVAGDPAVMAWHDDAVLGRSTALAIAAELDHPRRLFGVEVAGGSVWHCSLSLRAEEGQLSDEKWAAIAHDLVDGMGFSDDTRYVAGPDGHGELVGRAGCRWVAVRHGVSTNGNDHVHIAVSLVREDGTKASVWNDRPRAQRVAGELERKHGLEVLESRAAGRGSRGVKPAEVATAARRGDVEAARPALARMVRGCATAAADEAEFVRRLRRGGLLVRPRYVAGRDDVVAGYSVALRLPANTVGQRPVWYGGGHLDRDLTLPRLRQGWPDTPTGAGDAVAEWNAGRRGARPVRPGRETVEPAPELWQQYGREVAALRERLRLVPVTDRATWAHVAHETAGAFAAWSVRVEPVPGPLAATADALARSAQLRAFETRTSDTGGAPVAAASSSVKGAALLLASIAHGGQGTVAQAVLLRQLANVAKAIHDVHQAAGEARRAGEIAAAVRTQLRLVEGSLPALVAAGHMQAGAGERAEHEAVRLARTGQVPVETAPVRAAGSPVPRSLRPGRVEHGTAARTTGDDVER
ncbi:relaxase/mobilization nuclease domain-containing protein [Aquipuribacter hungaricus]|uniref:Relaxase/mobilization nuclease domain-containing protein n=1 Tax=Aquipuribacter hungaricus TaxID=545624 RepID=A0ABV7WK28_9MICO